VFWDQVGLGFTSAVSEAKSMAKRSSTSNDKRTTIGYSRADFDKAYVKNLPALENAQEVLGTKLSQALAPFLERKQFRVRLIENRIKQPESLYEKALEDQTPLRDIFSSVRSERVRDLIGFRVVCHNLQDIPKIERALEEANRGLFALARAERGKSKTWLARPKKGGYRGVHIDVVYTTKGGKSWQAELQVRTMLQDAWANLVHSDLYKGNLSAEVVPAYDALVQGYAHLSDLLYALDRMSDLARVETGKSTLGPRFPAKWTDAFLHNMYTLIGFFSGEFKNVEYSEVDRFDQYRVDKSDVYYSHVLSVKSKVPTQFEVLIGGDTSSTAVQNVKLFRLDSTGSFSRVKSSIEIVRRNFIRVRPMSNALSTHHNYRIDCEWRGIFTNSCEYVFAPWHLYYPKAKIKYRLQVQVPPRRQSYPLIYQVPKSTKQLTGFIRRMMSDMTGSQTLGERMRKTDDGKSTKYDVEYKELRNIVFCLIPKTTYW
jgi:ppGpp synthetase/RelA/SpoT-type nucleotidyltranferase